MRGPGRDSGLDTSDDLGWGRKPREEAKYEEGNPADDILNLLDEMEPRPVTSKAETRATSISPTPAQRSDSEIGIYGVGNSRRKPKATAQSKLTSDGRPTTAPQEITRTLLKSKPQTIDSPPSRHSITKAVIGGEIRELPEEDGRSQASSRPTDLNDRESLSRGRTGEFSEPLIREERLSITQKIAKAVSEDREIQRIEHEKVLKELESKYKSDLESQKNAYERQVTSLEAALKHQESLGVLSTAITASADTLNTLSSKFTRITSFDSQLKSQEITAKMQQLQLWEQRLTTLQHSLDTEKQHMLEIMKKISEDEAEKNEFMEKEREEMRKNRVDLMKLQEFLTDQERSRNSEIAIEKQKLMLLKESMERENNRKIQEINREMNDLRLKQTLLEQQRAEIEQQNTAARVILQQKYTELETFRSKIAELEAKLTRKSLESEEKEKNAVNQWEKLQRDMDILQRDREKLEEEGRKLHEISLTVQEKSLEIASAREEIAKEREELLQMRQETQLLLGNAKNVRSKADMRQRELTNSMKAYEQMRFDLVRSVKTPQNRGVDVSLREIQLKLNEIGGWKRAGTPVPRRPSFVASEYMKDLQGYERARGDYQHYVTQENQHFIKTKLDTGVTESLMASFRVPKEAESFTRSALSS